MPAIFKAVTPQTKLIFICSPNNPTGNQIEEKDLLRILDLGLPTFFDEAYYELENDVHSRVYLLEKYPNMVVNRTFSKAMGLAGLRLGLRFMRSETSQLFQPGALSLECQPAGDRSSTGAAGGYPGHGG